MTIAPETLALAREWRTDPTGDPGVVGPIVDALLAAHAEIECMRPIVEACHAGIDALWNAYHSGAWEMNHHEDESGMSCPEDDTCACEGQEAARLLSKASGMLVSWSRIADLNASRLLDPPTTSEPKP